MAVRFQLPFADVGDGITPSDGAQLFFYITGTSTPKNTYSDEALTTANTNPVVADSDGLFSNIWVGDGERFKVILKDKYDLEVWSSDPVVSGISAGWSSVAFDTVADMVASTDLIIGMTATTAGYYSAGDGSGNEYKIVAAATGTDDGGSYIDLASTQAQGLFNDGKYSVERFGASTSRSAAQNAVSIQAAHDYIVTRGGGYVDIGGLYEISATIVHESLVIFRGVGWHTGLKLAASSNVDMVKTKDFDTLTGTGVWLASAGVQYQLGFENMVLDGNKANNTSGRGWVGYCKGIFTDNLLIRDCAGVGWSTEAGDVAGQTDWQDLPEGSASVWIRNCGSHGMLFRGPHDQHFKSLVVNECVGNAARFERSAGVYSGSADIDFSHNYACTNGIYISDGNNIRGGHIICESHDKEGLRNEGQQTQINMLQLYKNGSVGGNGNLVETSTASNNDYGSVSIRTLTVNATGAKIGGKRTKARLTITGDDDASNTNPALITDNTCQGAELSGSIAAFDGTGAIGWDNQGVIDSKIDLNITNCTTLWDNGSTNSDSHIKLRGNGTAGQTVFTGASPSSNDSEIWDISLRDSGGVRSLSRTKKQSGADVDLNSTAVQDINIGHDLIVTPRTEDVNANLLYAGTNTTWELDYLILRSVSSTQLNFRVRLKTAAGAAEVGKIIARVEV